MYTKFNEYLQNEKRFVVDNYKFKLFLGDIYVAESGFSIEEPDEWIKEKYATLFNLKTFKEFRGQGYMKYLLDQIFNYVKNDLKIKIITLNVYKSNTNAINLYLKTGFEIFIDTYDNDMMTLIKRL